MTDALKQYGEQVREAAAKVCEQIAVRYSTVSVKADLLKLMAKRIRIMPLPEPAPAKSVECGPFNLYTSPLPAPAQAQSDELARLRNLLAVIHGDGGHYTAEHGLTQSADEAAAIVHGLRARLAAAEAAAKERGEALRVQAMLASVQGELIPEFVETTVAIDKWVLAGMQPGGCPDLSKWAKEPKP